MRCFAVRDLSCNETLGLYEYLLMRLLKPGFPDLNSNISQTWGLDKYHGGRSGSPSNCAGVDLPSLIIPAKSFVVYSSFSSTAVGRTAIMASA